LDFGALEDFKSCPDLSNLHVAHAKNGGPIGKYPLSYSNFFVHTAVLPKDNLLVMGHKLPTNKVFVFSGNGKLYKMFDLENMMEGLKSAGR